MKKIILAFFLLSLLTGAPPCPADEVRLSSGRPEGERTATAMAGMVAATGELRKMRGRIEAAQDPAVRRELLREHMRVMRDAMEGMEGNGTPEAVMGDEAGTMLLMEKKLEMMQEILHGMALQQESVKGMMKRREQILK